MNPQLKRILNQLGAFAPLLTLLTMLLVFGFATDSFMTRANIYNIFAQTSPVAIMAVGITFVLICAQIDLSIAMMATLGGVICADLFAYASGAADAEGPISGMFALLEGAPPFLQFLLPTVAAILVCALLGLVNGVGTAYFGVPSFMISLAMMLITSGLALRITEGRPLFAVPSALNTIGNGNVRFIKWGEEGYLVVIPNIAIFAAIVLFAGFIVLRFTRFGRHVYAVGSNPEGAKLSGINDRAVLAACLCLCGMTAGIAGTVLIGRMGSAQATGYEDLLMDCIAAVVIGGTSLFGGKGGIGATVIGLFTIMSLKNGLNHLDIDIYSKEWINGVILLGALMLNITIDRLRSAK